MALLTSQPISHLVQPVTVLLRPPLKIPKGTRFVNGCIRLLETFFEPCSMHIHRRISKMLLIWWNLLLQLLCTQLAVRRICLLVITHLEPLPLDTICFSKSLSSLTSLLFNKTAKPLLIVAYFDLTHFALVTSTKSATLSSSIT